MGVRVFMGLAVYSGPGVCSGLAVFSGPGPRSTRNIYIYICRGSGVQVISTKIKL